MKRTRGLAFGLLSVLIALALLASCGDDSSKTTPDKGPTPDIGVADQAPEPDGENPDGTLPDLPMNPDVAGDTTPDIPLPDLGPDGPPADAAVDICSKAKTLTLTGGKGTVSDEILKTDTNNDIEIPASGCVGKKTQGAEHFYSVTLTAGKTYKITLDPNLGTGATINYNAALYLSTDCTSMGATCVAGADANNNDIPEVILFAPTTTGTYYIGVDSQYTPGSSYSYGKYDLTVEEVVAPANATCAKAQVVSFSGGKASVSGDTSTAANEFGSDIKCGSSPLDGGQVYYEVAIPAGQALKMTLEPQFSAYLVVFTKGANCDKAVIDSDCASGVTGALFESVSSGSTKTFLFNPSTAGTYVVAVDSNGAVGTFTLDFELITPPANAKCSSPQTVNFVNDKATVSGDTTDAPNQFGNQVTCGSTVYKYNGRQLYYKVSIPTGKALKWTLNPKFDADLLIFSDTCTVATINTDCGSDGATGDYEAVYENSPETGYLSPTTAGDYIIAVDGSYAADFGGFQLDLELVTKPANDVCASAKPLTLSGGKVTETGTTALSADEFATVKCGKTTAFTGPQLYYQVNLTSGKNYKVSVTPSGFEAVLYAFPKTTGCTAAAIDTACANNVADVNSTGETEALLLKPTATEDWIIVVDSDSSTSSSGDFTLKVEEATAPGNATCATAQAVTFASGKATVTGDTTLAADEFSTLKCGFSTTTFEGSQVYYKVAIPANNGLKLTLTPEFNAYMVLFAEGANCQETAIETDCASGTAGDKLGTVDANDTSTYHFTPGTPGNYLIAVDSTDVDYWGAFKLDLELGAKPANDTCAAATPLTFSGNTATATGDSTFATSSVALTSSSCVGYQSPGHDLFYSVQLQLNTKYTFTLTPDSGFDSMLYVFTDCQNPESSCVAGDDNVGDGKVETFDFTPTTAGTYYIAVDSFYSTDPSAFGTFTLEVKK